MRTWWFSTIAISMVPSVSTDSMGFYVICNISYVIFEISLNSFYYTFRMYKGQSSIETCFVNVIPPSGTSISSAQSTAPPMS